MASLLTVIASTAVLAGPGSLPTGFTDTRIAGSLDNPIGLARIPDAPGSGARVLFVEQRTARVRLAIGGSVTTVGNVPGVQSAEEERGLLGIAVDPGFPAAPYIYVHSTDNRFGNRVAISRFTLTGDLSYTGSGALTFSSASRYDLIRNMPDNATNHNGGTVRFGPDGRLYVSVGDDAVSCNAQLLTVLAGKILRLDVSRLPSGPGGPASYALLIPPGNPFPTHSDSGARLVWTTGLRNPFRFHIDTATGNLQIADVGQDDWEEITHVDAGGQNCGWPWREGPSAFSSCTGSQPLVVSPVAYYDHSNGSAIVSAGIYRMPSSGVGRFPAEYNGNSFFIDYYTGIMRRVVGSGAIWSAPQPVPGQPNATDWATGMENVSDVLEMPDGTLFYVRQSDNNTAQTGEIRRIAYTATLDAPSAMAGISLAAPRPTPSRDRVMLGWSQQGAGTARLVLLDVSGRVVRVLEGGAILPAGTHEREWDGMDQSGRRAAPGLYFARFEVGGVVRHARVMLLR